MSDCSIVEMAMTHPVFEIERDGESFRVDVPAGWTQGRGAFGGPEWGRDARARGCFAWAHSGDRSRIRDDARARGPCAE